MSAIQRFAASSQDCNLVPGRNGERAPRPGSRSIAEYIVGVDSLTSVRPARRVSTVYEPAIAAPLAKPRRAAGYC